MLSLTRRIERQADEAFRLEATTGAREASCDPPWLPPSEAEEESDH